MSFFAGYLLGLEEGGSPAVIQSLSVTQNGKYDAPAGVDGFNPVIVNVPDRYDEGFQAGYTEGDNDGREAQKKICDEEKAILIEEIDRQDKEIEELKDKQGYTFPEGTSYEDIYQFVGDDTVTDKTLGYYIQTTYTPSGDRERIITGVYNTNGEIVATLWGINAPINKWKVINVNVLTDGNYTVSYTWGNGTDSDSGYCRYLVGFGASGNQINVQSN